jgi:hypothetical protein
MKEGVTRTGISGISENIKHARVVYQKLKLFATMMEDEPWKLCKPHQVKNPAALETLLQVLSDVDSVIVLQEATTAKEATIDTLISRFEDLTSILKQAKRRRQAKRKYCGNDGIVLKQPSLDGDSKRTLEENRARMPTEILRQLTQSGFLSTADLAKTLLLTCKCYEIDLGREYVYEYLCRSRWRNITKLPPSLIADRGYYWLFRNMALRIYKASLDIEEPATIPPPAFDYADMLFSVSIRDGSGKEIVSEVLCGDQLDTLKGDGCASAILEQPIIIGTYPVAPHDAYARYAERDMKCDNWSVTVHLFRLDQNKCCCVHDSGSCEWDSRYCTEMALVHGLVAWVDSSAQQSATLELDERGKLLESRIQEYDRHYPDDDVQPFQGIHFGVDLACFVQAQAPPHPDDPSAQTVVLEFGEVELKVMRQVNDTDGECAYFTDAGAHGVTLPHLLEHLKIWDPND